VPSIFVRRGSGTSARRPVGRRTRPGGRSDRITLEWTIRNPDLRLRGTPGTCQPPFHQPGRGAPEQVDHGRSGSTIVHSIHRTNRVTVPSKRYERPVRSQTAVIAAIARMSTWTGATGIRRPAGARSSTGCYVAPPTQRAEWSW